jgi:hypothetical protein
MQAQTQDEGKLEDSELEFQGIELPKLSVIK